MPRRTIEDGPAVACGCAVVHTDGQARVIASTVKPEFSVQPLWEDDITVRLMTEPSS